MIYITLWSNIINSPGVWRKVQAQYHVFKQAFGNAYYTIYNGHMMHLFDEGKLIEKKPAITKKECYEIIIDWMVKYQISKSYIRYSLSDRWLLDFLQKQKKLGVKSILEFPTIPYDNHGYDSLSLAEDIYCREHLHEYIECCTTYSNFSEVFKIPCIVLANGVDLGEQRAKKFRKKDGTIVLLAVACFSACHGYERVIQGMHDYYADGGRKNIILNLVGDDGRSEAVYYKRIVEECHLQCHVTFHGELHGGELDEIYDNSDIAVSPLGLYKVGMESAAPIKTGEYCARGIPFIYGYDDISIDQNNYFTYKVSNDATPVDIRKIIDFYEGMYDGRDFVYDMRRHASSCLAWNILLKPVLDYLS